MRKVFLLLALITFVSGMKAQITLNTIYPAVPQGLYPWTVTLYMVNLEFSGMKYVYKSDVPANRFLKFYNLDHSLWKTINCNSFPTEPMPNGQQYQFDAIYISENLFDCDSMVEFMYVSSAGSNWFTGIYKENGTALMLADSLGPWVKGNTPQQSRPIYNTPGGTRMILGHQNNTVRVYNLPCGLSTGIDQKMLNADDPYGMNVFPNPSFYESTINYYLPKEVQSAEIIINDMSGREIKRYRVDQTFSSLLIPQSDMAPGTYIYSLNANGKALDSKKIVLNPR